MIHSKSVFYEVYATVLLTETFPTRARRRVRAEVQKMLSGDRCCRAFTAAVEGIAALQEKFHVASLLLSAPSGWAPSMTAKVEEGVK